MAGASCCTLQPRASASPLPRVHPASVKSARGERAVARASLVRIARHLARVGGYHPSFSGHWDLSDSDPTTCRSLEIWCWSWGPRVAWGSSYVRSSWTGDSTSAHSLATQR